eukprot:scaffold104317_cov50-Prasinocladus_malaysianus.AAC.1
MRSRAAILSRGGAAGCTTVTTCWLRYLRHKYDTATSAGAPIMIGITVHRCHSRGRRVVILCCFFYLLVPSSKAASTNYKPRDVDLVSSPQDHDAARTVDCRRESTAKLR